MLTNCTQPREKYMWIEIERLSYPQNIRGWRWEDSVTLSNLSMDKCTISVKVFEIFKLMPIPLLLPRWEVMIDYVQGERCVACLYTPGPQEADEEGFLRVWEQLGLNNETSLGCVVRSCLKNKTTKTFNS